MEGAITITLRPQKEKYPISVGDKIKLKKGSPIHKTARVKNKQFVYRLMRRPGKFIPYFVVTFVDNVPPNYNFHLKPYNF